MATRILFLISGFLITLTLAEVPVATQTKPGEEFVYVQTSSSGARPIARKEKATLDDRPFETAHKLPPYVTYILNQNGANEEIKEIKPGKQKREASPAKPTSPAPAPAGSIKLDPKKLIEKYKAELKTSSTAAPKTTTKATRRRTKKEARPEAAPPTSPRPILTSGAPPTPRSLKIEDAPLVASGSEKQRSRIQIKKGPNGQEYEYEYVYYYYDDDDDKETTEKALNSHDGPARDELTTTDNEEKTNYSKEAASNEVIPSARGRSTPRGRQLEDEDTVGEDRLPPSTRFPPRGRNIATTSAPEEETKAATTAATTARGRGRGRPTTAVPTASTEADSVSEETQVAKGSRGRTRANVRRPSLDLVDSASFNTHSGTAGAEPPSGGPSFPSDLPSGPVRFLGATPNERMDLQDADGKGEKAEKAEKVEEAASASTEEADVDGDSTASTVDATTTMSPMDKVALDLYAILQGTQKLSGEEDIEDSTATTDADGVEVTTLEADTTEVPTTEYTTPSTTTTTTTTTTTPAPTTTTTTEAPAFGRGRFRGGAANRRKHGSTTAAPSSTEAASSESKPKGRFGRPSFGRPRPGSRTTAEPAHEPEANKEESKPSSRAKPMLRYKKKTYSGNHNLHSRVTTDTYTTSKVNNTTELHSTDSTSNETESSTQTKPKSRYTNSYYRRSPTRARFGAARKQVTSTESSGDQAHEESSSSSTSKPALSRPRPGFNVRGRGRSTTAAPAEGDAPAAEEAHSEDTASSTAKPRIKVAAGGGNVRPLRPGPRINIAARGRPGAATTTTAAPDAPAEETAQEEGASSDEPKEEAATSPAPVEDKNPLNRLRNRQRANPAAAAAGNAGASAAKPKAAASASVQVRRVNPLIGRRKIAAEPSTTEAPHEAEPTEAAASEDSEDTEASAPSSSTTEEPKGLNKLLAGRRRLAARQPGTHN